VQNELDLKRDEDYKQVVRTGSTVIKAVEKAVAPFTTIRTNLQIFSVAVTSISDGHARGTHRLLLSVRHSRKREVERVIISLDDNEFAEVGRR